MGRVHAYASQPHYVDHLAPIWHALDPAARGTFRTTPDRKVTAVARRHQIRTHGTSPAPARTDLVLVAGAIDLNYASRPVLVEHGAGQTYEGIEHKSWAGGTHRHRAIAFVVPNERVADANRARYPDALQIIAAPRVEALRNRARAHPAPPENSICFSRHWDSVLVPELRSAWTEYAPIIQAIATHDTDCPHPDTGTSCSCDGYQVTLHAHPRALAAQRRQAYRWQLPLLEHFDDVITSSHLYVIDNSSTAYEWIAATGRPTICLNASYYRRDVHHGLRFWDLPPGPQVDHPDELPAMIRRTLGPDLARYLRARTAAEVFPIIDDAATITARAIEALL